MGQVASVKRYIDDGAGQFTGTTRQFSTWIKKVNENIAPYGLEIDEFQVENTAEYVSFLDVQFTFDHQGQLQTDLYVKETDSIDPTSNLFGSRNSILRRIIIFNTKTVLNSVIFSLVLRHVVQLVPG